MVHHSQELTNLVVTLKYFLVRLRFRWPRTPTSRRWSRLKWRVEPLPSQGLQRPVRPTIMHAENDKQKRRNARRLRTIIPMRRRRPNLTAFWAAPMEPRFWSLEAGSELYHYTIPKYGIMFCMSWLWALSRALVFSLGRVIFLQRVICFAGLVVHLAQCTAKL